MLKVHKAFTIVVTQQFFVVKIISCCIKEFGNGIKILGEMSANVYTFAIERRGKLFLFWGETFNYVALTKSLASRKLMVCLS